jgi:hypothetical protein
MNFIGALYLTGDIAIGDFNGDGRPDMALGSSDSRLRVYINGGGMLIPTYTGLIPRTEDMLAADMNGDQLDDIVSTNRISNSVSVVLSNGDGTMAPAVTYPTSPLPYDCEVGDMDGDGDLDIVVGIATSAAEGRCIKLYLNNGDGSLAEPATIVLPFGPLSVSLGDVDRDGDLDIAAHFLYEGSTIIVRNDGGGSYVVTSSYATGSEVRVVKLVDLNHDNHPDMVHLDGFSYSISVRMNNGDGTFGAASYNYAFEPSSLAVADFNGDGHRDLIVTPNLPVDDGKLAVLLGNGDGTFATAVNYPNIGGVRIAFADMDGDGDNDLLAHNGTMRINVNNGNGTYSPPGLPPAYTTVHNARKIAVADYENDGDLDVFVATANNGLTVKRNNGDGTFTSHVTQGVNGGGLAIGVDHFFGDDEYLDVVLVSSTMNLLNVLKGRPDGTFQQLYVQGCNSQPSCVAKGDVNGDGRIDVVVGTFLNDIVEIHVNNGTNFNLPAHITSGDGVRGVALGDLDGDGDLDIVTANYNSKNVAVHFNTGGVFGPAVFFAAGNGCNDVVIGDVDGDGDLDVCTANKLGDNVTVLRNDGTGVLSSLGGVYAGVKSNVAVTLADIDGDGDLDIAMAGDDTTVRHHGLLFNTGDGTFEGPVKFVNGNAPGDVKVGDFDNDGHLDMVVSNINSSSISVHLNKTTCCPADFDGTGFVDVDDFTAFVLAFEAGTDNADFDDSGFVDTDDFDAFVAAFEAGC